MNYKFLILLPTYNRPVMVKTAIHSVLSQDYDNYELVIIDDNESRTVNRSITSNPKVKYVLGGQSEADKKAQGGSMHGLVMNQIMKSTDADIAIILCDDDALVPGYLSALNEYYNQNENKYSYCHVRKFNPTKETISDVGERKDPYFTNVDGPILPSGKVDASQVSWFLTEDKFKDIGTRNLDMDMFGKLQARYGKCSFNGIDGQYKAIFPGQLGNTKHEFEG